MEESHASAPRHPSRADGPVPALAELSQRLDDMRSLDAASAAVSEFAVLHLGADLAGVSLRRPNGKAIRLAASSNDLAKFDAAEDKLGQGPGLTGLDDGAVITVADTRADRRWPEWSSAAAERQVLSACLVGMPALPGCSLTLRLFSRRADAFAAGDRAGLTAIAKLVGLSLRHVDRLTNLEEAMTTRDLIGQAQGIIMERYGLTSEQAMQFLRRSSQHTQEKVRQIALRLVAPGTPDPGGEPHAREPGSDGEDPAAE